MLPILQEDFGAIKRHFDDLNNDPSHFVNSNDICTPLGCVKEMVDAIPPAFWKRRNLKVLDSCCGNGNFHAYIQKKTALGNLFFNDVNEKRLENVRRIFGGCAQITQKDFLGFSNAPAYDLIVSNPPYAKFNNGVRVSKNHNLARAFILKALTITKPGGYILFIVPNNWMSFSDRNVLPEIMSRYQFIRLSIGTAKKYFPQVGSSFTWFLLQKSPNRKPFKVQNSYIKQDTKLARLDEGVRFIPLYYSQEVRRIFNKTIYSSAPKYPVETTSDLHHYTKKHLLSALKDKRHPYRIIHTPTQTAWSSVPHKYQEGWKVFLSLTNQYGTFIDNCGMTQSIAFIRCASKKEAVRVKRELDNDVFVFLNNLTRYGNFNNVRVMQRFPLLSKVQLTAKESAFIDWFLKEKDDDQSK